MKAEGLGYMQKSITIQDFLKLPSYFMRGVKYHATGHIYTRKPICVCLNVTHRCNSKCVMCSYWEEPHQQEITIAEIKRIFSNPLFSSVESYSFSGGEPTQREDLVEIVQAVLDTCPQIQEISLFSNGLDPDVVIDKVEGILALPNCQSLKKFTVSISLDGIGDTHQKIRRVPQAFERAVETINRLKELQHENPLHVCSTCVVQPTNIDDLEKLARFGQELELPMSFIPVFVSELLGNDTADDTPLKFTQQQLKGLKFLFSHQMLTVLPMSNTISWQEYFSLAGGERRRLPCFMKSHYAGVDVDGTLYMCGGDSSLVYGNALEEPADKIWFSKKATELRRKAEECFCPTCTICCNTAFALREEFFYATKFLLKEKTRKIFGG